MVGEAKRRKKLRERVLGNGCPCIYCGSAAKEVDHFPPRIMFKKKQRPRGLEFPACEACNRGSKDDEQVAAFIARMYPDAQTPFENEELQKLIKSVDNNYPGLLEELFPTPGQHLKVEKNCQRLPYGAQPLNAGGPLLNRAILSFGAKLCCAMRYEATQTFMPLAGAIQVRWMSNYQAWMGDYPPSLHQLFPKGETLRQGKNSVGRQFRYAYAIHPIKPMSYHIGVFRETFAVYGVAADDASLLAPADGSNKMTQFRPGWLRETVEETLEQKKTGGLEKG